MRRTDFDGTTREYIQYVPSIYDRIAVVAGVAGTVGDGYTCSPSESIPMCHFHGTDDTNVGYGIAAGGVQDNTFGMNVTDWISYWNANNGCGTVTLEGACLTGRQGLALLQKERPDLRPAFL